MNKYGDNVSRSLCSLNNVVIFIQYKRDVQDKMKWCLVEVTLFMFETASICSSS